MARTRSLVYRAWLVAALFVISSAACDRTPAVAPSERTIATTPATSQPISEGDWPTYHHDNARTGLAPGAYPVGPVAVGWTATLDGAVYGQPLVIGDTVFAATENDTVYGLVAATGSIRWSTHLGTPMLSANLPCGNINPLGITSTMAYDKASGLLFALAETAGAHHTLFGLDARTGAVMLTRAAEPPRGDRVAHQQRSALTVLDATVYVAYGGLAGDCGSYIGSVVALPIVGDGPAISYAVPTTREGGIWAPGGASVIGGRLLYATGNGESVQGAYDGSDSVLALAPDLRLIDRFAPSTWAQDNAADLDLGSMTPAVVSGYVFIAGKRGTGYTLRLDRLGGVGGQVAQAPVCAAFGGAAVEADTVYVPCRDGTRAVRVDQTGQIQVLWHASVAANGSPVIGGDAIWVVDYDRGVLYLLDKATGAVREQVSVGTLPHFASPTLAGGRAYLGTMRGVVQIRG